MIVLDTNVLSELARSLPAPTVLEWVDGHSADMLATTAITVAELLYGVERLPGGRRQRELRQAFDLWFSEDLQGRVLPFDGDAAEEYARLTVAREKAGRRISVPDAQIAAICRSRNAVLATRNSGDFVETGLDLVNPWNE